MKFLRFFCYFLIFVALVGGSIYYYGRPKPIAVLIKTVDQGKIEATVVNTRAGTVKPCRRARLSPSIGGQIAQWPVHEGMTVKQGDLLLALWNDDIKAQLTLAGSEYETSRARMEATCLQADIASRNADRYRALQQTGAASEEQVDSAITTAKTRQAECRAAEVTTQVSKNKIAVIKANLQRTLVYAPFEGIIAELNGELGEYLTPSPPGIQTLPAIDLIDQQCFYVSAPIDEVDAAKIKKGMDTRITLDAFRGRAFAGKVTRIADYVLDIEKQARTVEIEVSFTTPADMDTMLAGYSADAEVILKVKKNVLRLPTEAILEGNRVFVLNQTTGRLQKRIITTGLSNWEYTEVVSGVSADENVVISVERSGLEDGVEATVEQE